MLRCYSDPCTSSNFRQEVLSKDSCRDESRNCLVRAPSLPPCIGREEKVQERKSNGGKKITLNRQLSLQASKTTCSDGKIKSSGESSSSSRPMANSPDLLPPRHSHNKAMIFQRSSRLPRNQEVEAINNTNEAPVARGRHSNPKRMLQKSHSDLAFQELQGFKDLGFTFDNEDLSPDVLNILPGLQGSKIDESKQARRPYLSEVWHVQRPAPPLPARVSKNSAEDMKAQIKFWARAVATNVRQEC
ncbi:Detected protein of unknown function [Hibiscus syriacus]|uniref:Uncharacterized protein n=1 Tax=Hibiscus syriacus TaxID=106335 RepID=A0A6A3AI17_HIBSY|nr:Detected protein of unknown function [Hibiscus syriacus]